MKDNEVFQPNAMSQISHELRIPLTGIFGVIHFLKKTTLSAQQKEYLQQIYSFSKQLLSIEDQLHSILKKKDSAKHF